MNTKRTKKDAPRGRPVGDREARQAEMAQLVIQVVARVGFEGASMRAIAAEGGFSTGVLLHYFQNREELLTFSIDYIFAGLEKDISEAVAGKPPLEAILDICEHVLPNTTKRNAEWSVWTNILARATRDENFREKIRSRSLRTRKLVIGILEAGVNDKSVREDTDLEEIADLLLALVEGMGVLSSIHKNRYSRVKQLRMIKLVLDSVRI